MYTIRYQVGKTNCVFRASSMRRLGISIQLGEYTVEESNIPELVAGEVGNDLTLPAIYCLIVKRKPQAKPLKCKLSVGTIMGAYVLRVAEHPNIPMNIIKEVVQGSNVIITVTANNKSTTLSAPKSLYENAKQKADHNPLSFAEIDFIPLVTTSK